MRSAWSLASDGHWTLVQQCIHLFQSRNFPPYFPSSLGISCLDGLGRRLSLGPTTTSTAVPEQHDMFVGKHGCVFVFAWALVVGILLSCQSKQDYSYNICVTCFPHRKEEKKKKKEEEDNNITKQGSDSAAAAPDSLKSPAPSGPGRQDPEQARTRAHAGCRGRSTTTPNKSRFHRVGSVSATRPSSISFFYLGQKGRCLIAPPPALASSQNKNTLQSLHGTMAEVGWSLPQL